jgi:hypothetical protein
MGFWVVRVRDPIVPMRDRRYNEFKLIDISQDDLSAALRVVRWVSRQPYEIVGHNCMNATYDVLRAYGVDGLPVPAHHWEPNHWFDHVHGQHYQIDDNDVRIESDLHGAAICGPAQADVESLFADDPSTIEPLRPAWRTANTSAWREFEAARAAAPWVGGADHEQPPPAPKRLLSRIRQLLRIV